MATRLYLASSGTPGSTPTVRADWERSSAAFLRAPMATVKSNTALATLSAVFGATGTSQTCYYQGVSKPLDVDQTILAVGTADLVIGKCGETSLSGDAHLALIVRVMVGDTDVERTWLASKMSTSTEFPLIASAATRVVSPTIGESVALAGDRIVVEIGIHGVTPANEVMQLRVADPRRMGRPPGMGRT